MGIAEPRDRVGFHAHIYFPSQRFVFKADEAEASDADDSAAGNGSWGIAEKLRVLSNKAAAAECIERFNAEWAAAAYHFAAETGQVPDFTHLSYVRLGLAKLPQPTLGAAATALERRGVATRKGDEQVKRGVADAAARVAQWDTEMSNVQAEHDVAHEQMHAAVRSVTALDPLYGMVLLSVADAESTPTLARAMSATEVAAVAMPDASPSFMKLALRPAPPRGVRPVL